MFNLIRSAQRAVRRFRRDRKGAAALEFGLVALPFFLLTFGLAEIALIGFAQASLDDAVSETAREIRTGQAQTNGLSYTQIKGQLCAQITDLMPMDCANNLYLDVNTFASFVTVQNSNPVQNNTFNTSGFGYNPGVASSIVVVRAYYRWQVLTPFFQAVFANVGGGQRILSSTMMFRNEPFST